MAIRTGKQSLGSLRDDRALFIDVERVADVTTDSRLPGVARNWPNFTTCRTGARRADDLLLAAIVGRE
jgi:hypothetical protein